MSEERTAPLPPYTGGPLHNPGQPELTEGQEIMDVNFNVGGREDINAIKQICAEAHDTITRYVNAKVEGPNNLTGIKVGRIKRLEALAKTHLETACMLGVKAVTR